VRKRLPRQKSELGVALVTTVIVVAVLAVVAVAFMQSASTDRLSSRTVANYYRAQLAAAAGLNAALASFSQGGTASDGFLVVANDQRQLFVGRSAGEKNFTYTALFSSAGSAASRTVTGAQTPTINVEGKTTNFTFVLPGGGVAQSPIVAWVPVEADTAGGLKQERTRFSFWVQDLAGNLDLGAVGAVGAVAKRPTGTNPAEIALWSIFEPGAASGIDNETAAKLVAERDKIFTVATARMLAPDISPDAAVDLAAAVQHDEKEPDLIPFGFNYPDQGKPKVNLNTKLSAEGAQDIIEAINTNLPVFAQSRAGGMDPETYLNYLAANIVDYADEDSTPTLVGGQAGNEAIPWLNEIYDRCQWQGHKSTGKPPVETKANDEGGTAYWINISVETFVEFWNMSSAPAQGTLRLELDERQQDVTVNDSDVALAEDVWVFEEAVALQPNEYKVLVWTNEIPSIFWGPTQPAANARLPMPAAQVNYKLYWQNVLVDESKGGLERPQAGAGIQRLVQNHWRGNAFPQDANRGEGRVGDPRIGRHVSVLRRNHTYAPASRTSWGGRNYAAPLNEAFNEVKNWSDGTYIATSPAGRPAASVNQLPTEAADLATKYPHAPSKISNAGAYTNLAELGNIFDPIQWNINSVAGRGDVVGDTPSSATAGGGHTLRVGRAEHPRFAQDGARASQLLDLFSISSTVGPNAERPLANTRGKINLNTASPNVLRALAAGVFHQSDPALLPNGQNFVVPPSAVNEFVNAVVAFRAGKPFFSPSELSQLTTGQQAGSIFGNKAVAGVQEWSDAAAEEWFSKVFPLASVRSRNFLVYVVGEALQPSDETKVLSTCRMVYQVYMQPVRDQAGLTTGVVPRIIRSWSL
jgi:hypothetical protein